MLFTFTLIIRKDTVFKRRNVVGRKRNNLLRLVFRSYCRYNILILFGIIINISSCKIKPAAVIIEYRPVNHDFSLFHGICIFKGDTLRCAKASGIFFQSVIFFNPRFARARIIHSLGAENGLLENLCVNGICKKL